MSHFYTAALPENVRKPQFLEHLQVVYVEIGHDKEMG